MYVILRWIVNSLALMIVTYVVPGIEVKSFWTALIVVLFLGIVNALIRPFLILLTLPVNILTLGVFTLFINAFMFWLVGTFVKGFDIMNYATAFWGALIYWLITWATNGLLDSAKNN